MNLAEIKEWNSRFPLVHGVFGVQALVWLFGRAERAEELEKQMGTETKLPNIEVVSAKVHEAWMQSKAAQGVTTRKAEDGEELMVPYDQLSEKSKQLDRGSVQAVYDAITALTTLNPR